MANTTFKGPVRSTRGFQVVSKNKLPNAANSDVETIRMSSGMPDFTGLSLTDTATGASITLVDMSLNVINYTGAAACAAALPAAKEGSVCVYVQADETEGGTNTLTFNAAGDDVWKTGSVIESRATNEVTFDISAEGETQLVFTPADAATNLFTIGSKIAFICYEDGVWDIATEMGGAPTLLTGAFAFAA
tara:strand:- start:70 stop:639 length:570 start_codon:yes stop_codon:yes gene_type:complete